MLAGGDQHREGLLRAQPVPRHQDALGLSDDVAGLQCRLQVLDLALQVVDAPLVAQRRATGRVGHVDGRRGEVADPRPTHSYRSHRQHEVAHLAGDEDAVLVDERFMIAARPAHQRIPAGPIDADDLVAQPGGRVMLGGSGRQVPAIEPVAGR